MTRPSHQSCEQKPPRLGTCRPGCRRTSARWQVGAVAPDGFAYLGHSLRSGGSSAAEAIRVPRFRGNWLGGRLVRGGTHARGPLHRSVGVADGGGVRTLGLVARGRFRGRSGDVVGTPWGSGLGRAGRAVREPPALQSVLGSPRHGPFQPCWSRSTRSRPDEEAPRRAGIGAAAAVSAAPMAVRWRRRRVGAAACGWMAFSVIRAARLSGLVCSNGVAGVSPHREGTFWLPSRPRPNV